MNKKIIKKIRNKFTQLKIDGYVVPKNDDYFTEYSKTNRLKIISNFSGAAGIAIILNSLPDSFCAWSVYLPSTNK